MLLAVISFLSGVLVNGAMKPVKPRALVEDVINGALTNWYSGGDDGGAVVPDITFYMSPNASMKILTPSGSGKEYYAERGISLPFSKRLELRFWWQINSNAKTFEVQINWYYLESETTRRFTASLVYLTSGTRWLYLATDGYYHDVQNGTQKVPVADTAVWIQSRLVVDFGTHQYVEFSCGDRKFDLDEQALPNLVAFGGERIDWRFSVVNSNDNYSATANIDDFVLIEE